MTPEQHDRTAKFVREMCVALERYAADLRVPCPSLGCQSRPGQPCVAVPIGKVHVSRRILRLGTEGRPS
jgi:hypothetical protein